MLPAVPLKLVRDWVIPAARPATVAAVRLTAVPVPMVRVPATNAFVLRQPVRLRARPAVRSQTAAAIR